MKVLEWFNLGVKNADERMTQEITESVRCVSCRFTNLLRHSKELPLADIVCPNCGKKDLYYNLNISQVYSQF